MDVPPSPLDRFPFNAKGTAHLIGITGSGMKAVAEILDDMGWTVTGCDADPDPEAMNSLTNQGITVTCGHHISHLIPKPDVLIYSPAIPGSHRERAFASDFGLPQFSYVDFLRDFTATRTTVAVAGTHGKSTTTALIGHVLRFTGKTHGGCDPSLICGAEIKEYQRNGWFGTGPYTVVEACEFRRHFLELSAGVRCLLGIDEDHFDCYPTREDAVAAYASFAAQTPTDGVLIVNADCRSTLEIGQWRGRSVATFSLRNSSADFFAESIEVDGDHTRIHVYGDGDFKGAVRLPMWGDHNVSNALAAMATLFYCGLSFEEVRVGLESFPGLRRRLQRRSCPLDVPAYDDYAHHPTEVRAALQAVKAGRPDSRIVCVFQPHQMLRTRRLMAEFANSLSQADRVWLLPVYAAREHAGTECVDLSQELAKLVRQAGTPAELISELDRVWPTLQTDADSADVILTLGAGTLTRIHA
ncbi:MAG: UDP-N-acetylmuramate--L-alanine ligase [Planctomycetaceae bacterium]|nr:UDP-N-acetylmuramate--L-alanine ligase [Planctomycetaceae bacterium]